jgi:GR25 family glycosyltransferase involved in LPS biosynthesis
MIIETCSSLAPHLSQRSGASVALVDKGSGQTLRTALAAAVLPVKKMFEDPGGEGKNKLDHNSMKAFVINMDRDTDRLGKLREHFKDVGVPFDVSRFPAIDGRSIKVADDVAPWCMHFCTASMKGCGLSHLRLWKHCLDMGYERVLIFEDDVRLEPDWLKATENALLKLEAYAPKWDVLLLGSLLDDPRNGTKCTRTVVRPGILGGTHAYIVSANGLQNLVDAIPKVSWHMDGQIGAQAFQGNLQVYMVSPGVAHQAGMGDTSMAGEGGPSDAWPALLNRAASHVSTFGDVPLNYWLTVPVAQVAPGVPINAWTVIVLVAGLASRKKSAVMWSVGGVAVLVVAQIVMTGTAPLDMFLGVGLFFVAQRL